MKNKAKIFILAIALIIYFIFSISVNNSVSFAIEPTLCTRGFCVIGTPININFKLDNAKESEICITSKAFNSIEKIKLDSNWEINETVYTNQQINSDKKYNIIFSRCKLMDNPPWIQNVLGYIIDPIAYSGSKQKYEFKYPKISIDIGKYNKEDDRIIFEQITLKNSEDINWNCKIHFNVSQETMIKHDDIKIASSDDEYRYIYESTIETITKSGKTYGRDNIIFIADTCTSEIILEISPVCIVDDVKINIPSQEIVKEKLPNNKC